MAYAFVIDHRAAARKDFHKLRVKNGIDKRRTEINQVKASLKAVLESDSQWILNKLAAAKTGRDVSSVLRLQAMRTERRLNETTWLLLHLSKQQTRTRTPRAQGTAATNGPTDLQTKKGQR
jgi:hypothetical protein